MYLDQQGTDSPLTHPGMTRSEIAAEFPNTRLPFGIMEDGWWNQSYEDFHATNQRAKSVSEHLWAMAKSEERVAMISHDGFMYAMLTALLGRAYPLFHHNTAISHLSLHPGDAITVKFLNQVSHLPPELVS